MNLETFVFGEVLKQVSWSDESYTLFHYRDKDQDEVDLVIEVANGMLIGFEVKAAATVKREDFRGLRKLAGVCGGHFKLGAVLYDGSQTIPFGDHLFAVPITPVGMKNGDNWDLTAGLRGALSTSKFTSLRCNGLYPRRPLSRDALLLILQLISGDLRLFQALMNAEDNSNHLAPLKTRDVHLPETGCTRAEAAIRPATVNA